MTDFLGVEVEIPFAPAAGVINGPNVDSIVDRTQQILTSPLTFSRWASATYHGGEGNEPTYGQVYYHNELTGQTVNATGLPSVSIGVMETVYPELQKEAEDRGKVLIPGVSAAAGENPLEVLPEMAERLVAAGATRIEVNYSCPNKFVEGGNQEPVLSNDIETMAEVDEAILARVGLEIWIIRKIAPPVGERRILIPQHIAYFSQVAGRVSLSFNAVGGQSILTELGDPALGVPNNEGGLSGPATRLIGRDMLKSFRNGLPEHIQIDSSLGVDSGFEIHRRVDEGGANLASGATIYFENEKKGISYGETSHRIAAQYRAAKEVARNS